MKISSFEMKCVNLKSSNLRYQIEKKKKKKNFLWQNKLKAKR